MRRSEKVWKAWSHCRIVTRLAKRYLTLRSISASVGEGQSSELTAAARQAAPCTAQEWGNLQISGNWI